MFFNKKKKLDVVFINSTIYYNQLPSSIRAQLHALKSLDIYTKKHIDDVPLQTLKICKQLKLSEEKTEFIMMTSYLHDVGKIFVPSSILQKTGKLTDEEYTIMKTHAAKSYDICMQFDDLKQYAKIVRGHHESLDGSGYPDGLIGNQMTLEMRILKVADVYSALKLKRQYKDEMPLSKVFEILNDEVNNNKMDPEIVNALFKAIIAEKEYEVENEKTSLKGYNEQLEYNEEILVYLDDFIKLKMSSKDILNDRNLNNYLRKLENFDITTIKDVNRLLEQINDNIIKLMKNIKDTKNLKNDIKLLRDYQVKMENKMGW